MLAAPMISMFDKTPSYYPSSWIDSEIGKLTKMQANRGMNDYDD